MNLNEKEIITKILKNNNIILIYVFNLIGHFLTLKWFIFLNFLLYLPILLESKVQNCKYYLFV